MGNCAFLRRKNKDASSWTYSNLECKFSDEKGYDADDEGGWTGDNEYEGYKWYNMKGFDEDDTGFGADDECQKLKYCHKMAENGSLHIDPIQVYVNEEIHEITPEFLAHLRATHRRRLSLEEEKRRVSQFTERENEAHVRHQGRLREARKKSNPEDSTQPSGPPPKPPPTLKLQPGIELQPVRESYLPKWMTRRRRRRKRKRKVSESAPEPNNEKVPGRIQDLTTSKLTDTDEEPVRPVVTKKPKSTAPAVPKVGVATQTSLAPSSTGTSASTMGQLDSTSPSSGSSTEESWSSSPEDNDDNEESKKDLKSIMKMRTQTVKTDRSVSFAKNMTITKIETVPELPKLDSQQVLNEMERRLYTRIRDHTRSKAQRLLNEENEKRAAWDKGQEPIYENVSPFWTIQADAGPAVVTPYRDEYLIKKKERLTREKVEEENHPIYITSGKSDMSISLAPTVPSHLSDSPHYASSALGFFHNLDVLILRHEVFIWDAILSCKSRVKVKYKLVNGRAHKVFFLYEQPKGCCKQRVDLNGFDYYHMERSYSIKFKLFGPSLCYRRSVNIFSPPTNQMGTVVQLWCPRPKFRCKDTTGKVVATIGFENICAKGPLRRSFIIRDESGEMVGDIRGNCEDLLEHLFMHRKLFGIHYTKKISVGVKALLLGAMMMIYKAYYARNYVKKEFHDVTDERRYYWDYENVMANRPSFESSLGTMINYDHDEWRTFLVNEVNRDKCLKRASRWKVSWT